MPIDASWFLALEAASAAASFLGLVYVAVSLARNRDCGHKTLLWSVAAFQTFRSFYMLNKALVLMHGTSVGALMTSASCAVDILFTLFVFAQREDIEVTLRTSEAEERVRQDRLADREQSKLNLEYIALTTQQDSERMLAELRDRAAR